MKRMNRDQMLLEDMEHAQRKVRRNILEMYVRDNVDMLVMDEDPDWFVTAVDEYKNKTKGAYKHLLWTINPREGTDIELFLKKIDKALKKCWIEDWMFCIEQRGNGEDIELGKGMHCHIYTEISEKKNCYQCKREMFNTFKHIVGNKLHVNVRYSHKDENFRNYISGIKDSKEKMLGVSYDKIWRELAGLKNVYTPARDA